VKLIEKQSELEDLTEKSRFNCLTRGACAYGIVTSGMGRQYFKEKVDALEKSPWHLHIGAYPPPVKLLKSLSEVCSDVLFLEEGYPFLERFARGFWQEKVLIKGKLSGEVPLTGELNPDIVADALGLVGTTGHPEILKPAARPPRLCDGCPHSDTSQALKEVLQEFENHAVTTDIGCYTLASLPPYSLGETCVCMGASIGMAKGLSDTGLDPVIAIIGDSTFIHSGLPALVDAVHSNSNMTVLILDNSCVGMTGGQDTPVTSERLVKIISGLGVPSEHLRSVRAHPKKVKEMADVIREEIVYRGISVVISSRECVRTASRSKRKVSQ
jgi:indolepyruvate ferredoxin oxidoreductase alpha subunit